MVSSLQRVGIDTLTITMPFRGTPSMEMLTLQVDPAENGNLPPLPSPASLATLDGEPIVTGFVGYRTAIPTSYRITWTLTDEVTGQLHAVMHDGAQLYVDVPGVTRGRFPLDLHSDFLVSLETCRGLLGERLKAARPPGEALDVVDRDPVLNQQTSRLDLMQYPSRAMREGVEGTVKASMQVDEYGYIAECTVAVSSGSTYLDDATCRDLKRYARFYPARDASGEATPGTYVRDVRWELED
ncbi:energy transducer TonB [Alteriqipengyuania sp. WL0013]|uniref:energy transducer TonB n=1 Tax=Alteriqipengyuania sp. WL0013 TaxID=3110773 RepID=UPI002BC884B7|nr:energy transducer TonB [Alteriqipengyuania sp. WL0013]MEB3416592.1 energy transducer TonB [Alteriqipengyuania sp. WL0013]